MSEVYDYDEDEPHYFPDVVIPIDRSKSIRYVMKVVEVKYPENPDQGKLF